VSESGTPATPSSNLPTLRQIDQALIWIAMVGLISLSWWYLIDMARDMSCMAGMADMSDASGMRGEASVQSWSLADFWMMLIMWIVMMIGMMIPSAVRTIMIYARIARQAGMNVVLATYSFIFGYIPTWSLFSLGATLLQWGLSEAALLSPMMVSTSDTLGASLLISAGVYQLTPMKEACLKHCQSPITFISQHFKKGNAGAFAMGFHHGAYCLGCCWFLMGLLFVAGVMNLLWILAITVFVMLEKLVPMGRYAGKITGGCMMIAGLLFLIL
jgi:predicted metal-binding membrane protein